MAWRGCGGEAVAADPDSELVAALLALNAIFVVARKDGTVEVPALSFLRAPRLDLAGGALVTSVLIPGAPHGVALARASALPSPPPLVAVVATTSYSGGGSRACAWGSRVSGSALPRPRGRGPARADHRGGEHVIALAADLVARLAPFRDDTRATAAQRRRIARPLALRAVSSAVERGRRQRPPHGPTCARCPRRGCPHRCRTSRRDVSS